MKFARVGGTADAYKLRRRHMNCWKWKIFTGYKELSLLVLFTVPFIYGKFTESSGIYCSGCNSGIGRILLTLTKLEIRQNKLEEQMKIITGDVSDMKSKK